MGFSMILVICDSGTQHRIKHNIYNESRDERVEISYKTYCEPLGRSLSNCPGHERDHRSCVTTIVGDGVFE